MKILLVTHYFPAHGGGVELVAFRLAQSLLRASDDLQIEWFSSAVDTPSDFDSSLSRQIRCHPIKTWNGLEKKTGIPCPLWSPSGLMLLWKGIRRNDCIHLHDYAYYGNLAAAIFCRLQQKPYVVTQHIGSVPFKQKIFRFILEVMNRTVGRWVLNRANAVFFISQEVRDYFARRGVARQTTLTPNGVDSQMFHPTSQGHRTVLREQLKLQPDNKVVLFVGRFVEKKGVPFLVDIAAEHPEYTWIFAGRGPLDPEDLLSVLPPHIKVLRDRKDSQIAELYQIADILVLPSVGEGFPLVVQEALACGTPVLVESALGQALPDAAPRMNMEDLEKPDDKERWVSHLISILSTQETMEQRQIRADWAAKTWSWEKCAISYLQVFERLISNRSHTK